ncbi:MAG TPA: hypothetical protein VMA36_02365 [Candidatus Limnocylindria bacterium]|nr:hypothetical protein [Candidatus Limnocylindria bacterium]
MRFQQAVFAYITTLVPYWRVSDDAWPLSDGSYLAGIGVLRNYGGDAMVVPLTALEDEALPELLKVLTGQVESVIARGSIAARLVIVLDDRFGDLRKQLPPEMECATIVSWSNREALAQYVGGDAP